MLKRVMVLLIPIALVAAACGDDDAATTTTEGVTTTEAPTTTAAEAAPAMGPTEVVFEAQSSDGSSIVVVSVTLPSPGFIAVHGDGGGSPGPVIGHSGLLPEGTSTDVEITLDEPLAATGLVFPMAHIDVNGNGEYEFFPPDNTVDGPAQTADGAVAVVGAEVTVETGGEASAGIVISGFSFGEPITVAVGETVTIRNEDAAAHTWTSDDGLFDSGTLAEGEEFTITFDEPGEFSFLCEFHPSMVGTITVTG
jgi:plastocyanin